MCAIERSSPPRRIAYSVSTSPVGSLIAATSPRVSWPATPPHHNRRTWAARGHRRELPAADVADGEGTAPGTPAGSTPGGPRRCGPHGRLLPARRAADTRRVDRPVREERSGRRRRFGDGRPQALNVTRGGPDLHETHGGTGVWPTAG